VKSYKRTLKITITEAERRINLLDGTNNIKSCGSIFDTNLTDIQGNLGRLHVHTDSNNITLNDLENLTDNPPGSENLLGHNSAPLVRVSLAKGFTEEITKIYTNLNLKIMGSKCDSCNTLRTDGATLMKCTRCKRKTYCSKACQLRDWSEGKHKLSCRAPKDFKINDLVRINGIVTRLELNGELVCIREITDDGHIIVADISNNEEFSVDLSNITLIVPVNERLDL
jgi:hypothetical protein